MSPSRAGRPCDGEAEQVGAGRAEGLLARGVDARNGRGGVRTWPAAGLPVTTDSAPRDAPS